MEFAKFKILLCRIGLHGIVSELQFRIVGDPILPILLELMDEVGFVLHPVFEILDFVADGELSHVVLSLKVELYFSHPSLHDNTKCIYKVFDDTAFIRWLAIFFQGKGNRNPTRNESSSTIKQSKVPQQAPGFGQMETTSSLIGWANIKLGMIIAVAGHCA